MPTLVHDHDGTCRTPCEQRGSIPHHPAQNLITIGLAWWLIMGLFVDGWAHNHLGDRLETFFTPWHALFYSGFLAVAAWVGWLGQRGWRAGRRGLLALPQGYELAALGVPVFALGGLGDMAWHTVFGIEVGVEALLSPTHLVLFLGAACIVSAPLVSAWRTPTARKAPPGWSGRAYWPPWPCSAWCRS
ncbi:hypothetical protein ACFSC4_23675 [Deinococcus malanensis]|uniref:hypothetical protein n=1 Tax=Deinococcus malanensis TaxID=1706855 RepID=UPI00363B608C